MVEKQEGKGICLKGGNKRMNFETVRVPFEKHPKFRKDVAGMFLNTITNAADSLYRMPISVSFKTNDD